MSGQNIIYQIIYQVSRNEKFPLVAHHLASRLKYAKKMFEILQAILYSKIPFKMQFLSLKTVFGWHFHLKTVQDAVFNDERPFPFHRQTHYVGFFP